MMSLSITMKTYSYTISKICNLVQKLTLYIMSNSALNYIFLISCSCMLSLSLSVTSSIMSISSLFLVRGVDM